MVTRSNKKAMRAIAEHLGIGGAIDFRRADCKDAEERRWRAAARPAKTFYSEGPGRPRTICSELGVNISASHVRLITAITEKYLHDLKQTPTGEFYPRTLYGLFQYA